MAKYKAEIYAKVAETEGNYETISVREYEQQNAKAMLARTQGLLNIAKRATRNELAILLEHYEKFEKVNELQRELQIAKEELINVL